MKSNTALNLPPDFEERLGKMKLKMSIFAYQFNIYLSLYKARQFLNALYLNELYHLIPEILRNYL